MQRCTRHSKRMTAEYRCPSLDVHHISGYHTHAKVWFLDTRGGLGSKSTANCPFLGTKGSQQEQWSQHVSAIYLLLACCVRHGHAWMSASMTPCKPMRRQENRYPHPTTVSVKTFSYQLKLWVFSYQLYNLIWLATGISTGSWCDWPACVVYQTSNRSNHSKYICKYWNG